MGEGNDRIVALWVGIDNPPEGENRVEAQQEDQLAAAIAKQHGPRGGAV